MIGSLMLNTVLFDCIGDDVTSQYTHDIMVTSIWSDVM